MNKNFPIPRLNRSFSIITTLIFVVVLMAFLFALPSCDAGSKGPYNFQSESTHWLQFRGPNASGIAPENADPPIHFNADTSLLWKTEMLPGWSSPCIVNDRIFLTGFDDSDSLLYTMAINRENGEILWKNSVSPNGYYDKHPIHTYANSTMASNGKKIFASFPNYGLIAYDLDGNKEWDYTHEIISQFNYAGASSPVVVDSIIVLLINSGQDPRIIALDTRSGDPVWTIRATEQEWASMMSTGTPVVYNDLLIMHFQFVIVAFNLLDQEVEWWLNTPTLGVGTPVIRDNLLFVNTWTQGGEKKGRGEILSFSEMLELCDENANQRIERDEFSDDMNLYTRPENIDAPYSNMYLKDDVFFSYFDSNRDQAIEDSEWTYMLEFAAPYLEDHGMLALPIEGSGERTFTEIKWKVNEDTPETPSPLVVNNRVFFIKDGGIVTVIDIESGEVVHKDRIGAAGGYLSSPMLAGNRIYTCSFNGTVSVLSADDFSVLAQNKLREKIGASPVALDDVLYLRTDKHLYAFREQ
jgi:outer membrane protein assembly factor BamB